MSDTPAAPKVRNLTAGDLADILIDIQSEAVDRLGLDGLPAEGGRPARLDAFVDALLAERVALDEPNLDEAIAIAVDENAHTVVDRLDRMVVAARGAHPRLDDARAADLRRRLVDHLVIQWRLGEIEVYRRRVVGDGDSFTYQTLGPGDAGVARGAELTGIGDVTDPDLPVHYIGGSDAWSLIVLRTADPTPLAEDPDPSADGRVVVLAVKGWVLTDLLVDWLHVGCVDA